MSKLELLHCLCSWILGWTMLIDGTIRVVSFGLMRPGLGYIFSEWILDSKLFGEIND